MLSDTSTSRQHKGKKWKLLPYQCEASQECSAFSGSKGAQEAPQREVCLYGHSGGPDDPLAPL